MNLQTLVHFFIENGRQWVREQRDAHRRRATPLSEEASRLFEPFFDAAVLTNARFVEVPIIANPAFFAPLRAMALPDPIDFTQMEGITFQDTVVLSRARMAPGPPSASLLFHELVHVVQYDLLGVERFVEEYVNGWAANGFRYEAIPLEQMAYELADRFTAAPTSAFAVRSQVGRRLGRA